jgi:hypothetical protein
MKWNQSQKQQIITVTTYYIMDFMILKVHDIVGGDSDNLLFMSKMMLTEQTFVRFISPVTLHILLVQDHQDSHICSQSKLVWKVRFQVQVL